MLLEIWKYRRVYYEIPTFRPFFFFSFFENTVQYIKKIKDILVEMEMASFWRMEKMRQFKEAYLSKFKGIGWLMAGFYILHLLIAPFNDFGWMLVYDSYTHTPSMLM